LIRDQRKRRWRSDWGKELSDQREGIMINERRKKRDEMN